MHYDSISSDWPVEVTLVNTCTSAPHKSIISMTAHQLWTKIQYKNLYLRI